MEDVNVQQRVDDFVAQVDAFYSHNQPTGGLAGDVRGATQFDYRRWGFTRAYVCSFV